MKVSRSGYQRKTQAQLDKVPGNRTIGTSKPCKDGHHFRCKSLTCKCWCQHI